MLSESVATRSIYPHWSDCCDAGQGSAKASRLKTPIISPVDRERELTQTHGHGIPARPDILWAHSGHPHLLIS